MNRVRSFLYYVKRYFIVISILVCFFSLFGFAIYNDSKESTRLSKYKYTIEYGLGGARKVEYTDTFYYTKQGDIKFKGKFGISVVLKSDEVVIYGR